MSTVLQQLNLPSGWSRAHIQQLASYVRERDRGEWCYGNRELFEKRHKEILKWIERYEEYAYEPDVVFEKAIK